jgi:hypothetical protein
MAKADEQDVQVDINITPPSKHDRGFLKRQRRFFDIMSRSRQFDPTSIDDMVEYIIEHCETNAPEEQVREALWEMSEDEIMTVMRVTGGVEDEDGNKNSVPPTRRGR